MTKKHASIDTANRPLPSAEKPQSNNDVSSPDAVSYDFIGIAG